MNFSNQFGMNMFPFPINFQQNSVSRLREEFKLCMKDTDLMQIGCHFRLENLNIIHIWNFTMFGAGKTPYEGGFFNNG